jgi:hypothetical protein
MVMVRVRFRVKVRARVRVIGKAVATIIFDGKL